MDHLSRVSAQSSRNKMNPHNLAICFAPVLMMDVNSAASANAAAAAGAAGLPPVPGSGLEIANISEPIQILKYLIEIWPKGQE